MKPLAVHHRETLEAHPDTHTPDPHQDAYSRTILGFWCYLMTDCILFGTLFASYAVLQHGTFGGPTSHDIFALDTAFVETMILLLSSITCGFAILASYRANSKYHIIGWLLITFALGATFVGIELHEFANLVYEGNSWKRSAFLSSFFTLVGTHGTHVTFGLLWMLVIMGQLLFYSVTVDTFRRLVVFNMFWHFLDLVWIFIFTFVYLIGVI